MGPLPIYRRGVVPHAGELLRQASRRSIASGRRGSASEIECYVVWLAEQSYSRASVRCRVPVLFAFGEFAWAGGARSVGDLPAHVEAFVAERVPAEPARLGAVAARERVKNVRGPIEQMLRLVVPGFTGRRRALLEVPFIDELPGFFEYLLCERGLRRTTLHGYGCYLRSFEGYLRRVGVQQLVELSPALISTFVAERSAGLARRASGCSAERCVSSCATRIAKACSRAT